MCECVCMYTHTHTHIYIYTYIYIYIYIYIHIHIYTISEINLLWKQNTIFKFVFFKQIYISAYVVVFLAFSFISLAGKIAFCFNTLESSIIEVIRFSFFTVLISTNPNINKLLNKFLFINTLYKHTHTHTHIY